MSEAPPHFNYHPRAYDPEVGAFEAIDIACECCGRARGWNYGGNIYSRHDVDNVCPWCIADGSVHRQYGASFCQDIEGVSGPADAKATDIPPEVIDEVLHRTPGYVSWQGAIWKTHCGDVGEFHGDISQDDLATLSPEAEALFRQENRWALPDDDSLQEFARHRYVPKGYMGIYKFVCRHCGIVRLHVDLS